jgi:hypothetical protein
MRAMHQQQHGRLNRHDGFANMCQRTAESTAIKIPKHLRLYGIVLNCVFPKVRSSKLTSAQDDFQQGKNCKNSLACHGQGSFHLRKFPKGTF